MRIEALQYFLTIAECGSYSQASRRLYISQQGLSKSVRMLEREFNVKLFEKAGRQLHLTEAGKCLIPYAKEQVALDRRTREALRAFSSDLQEPAIMLWAMPFASSVLFNFMKDELESWGLRNVTLSEGNLDEIMAALKGSDASNSLALLSVPLDEVKALVDDSEIEFIPLIASDLGIIGSPSLLSPQRLSIAVPEIAGMPIAAYSERVLDKMVDKLFSDASLRNVIMHTTNLKMIEETVGAGRAVTFWDSFSTFLEAENDPRIFVPIEDAPTFIIGIAVCSSGFSDEGRVYLSQFQKCIEATCAPYQASHPLPDGLVE